MTCRYGLQVLAKPTTRSISLEEAKEYCRVEVTEEDGLLTGLVGAAVQYAQDFTGRQFCTATLLQTFDAPPSATETFLRLARSPVQSITSIDYVDNAGATQTWDPTLYQVDTIQEPARILPVYGQIWPITRWWQLGAVSVTYVAGYGDAADVPDGIKLAIKYLVNHWYEFREPVVMGQPTKVPMVVESLLWMFRTGEYNG